MEANNSVKGAKDINIVSAEKMKANIEYRRGQMVDRKVSNVIEQLQERLDEGYSSVAIWSANPASDEGQRAEVIAQLEELGYKVEVVTRSPYSTVTSYPPEFSYFTVSL